MMSGTALGKIAVVTLALGLFAGPSAVAQVQDPAKSSEVTDQEMTFDGMVPEKKGLLKLSWVDPDIDFTVYTKVIPGEAYFEFRAVKKSSGLAVRSSNKREFWISDKDKQKLIDTVSDIFEEEIAKSKHFTVVEEPGPDTLIIRGGLLDIISKVLPAELRPREGCLLKHRF